MVFIMGMAATNYIKIPLMHSIRARVLWVNKISEENKQAIAHRGRYVIFSLVSPTGELVQAAKRVGCPEGDSLTSVGLPDGTAEYYCGGEYLGKSKTHTLAGAPLKSFRFDGVIPKGKFFATGDHKDSYDSKYIGLVDVTQVREVGWPVF